jgi:hypothetical protein
VLAGPARADTVTDGRPDEDLHELHAGVDEIVDARVWSGIHFRTADEGGCTDRYRLSERTETTIAPLIAICARHKGARPRTFR